MKPPKLPNSYVLGNAQHAKQVFTSLDRSIQRRDAAEAKHQDQFAVLPPQSQLFESIEHFRALTDTSRARPVCAVCGEFCDPNTFEEFYLNKERPVGSAARMPKALLKRVQRWCQPVPGVPFQLPNHPERPGLALLKGLALQWRYYSDDYSQLLTGGVDEDRETLTMCEQCYLYLRRRRLKKPPKLALSNGFMFGAVPTPLLGLTIAEWHVIRPFRVLAAILELHVEDPVMLRTRATQIKLRGNIVAFPQNNLSVAKTWPARPEDVADTMHVVLLSANEVLPPEQELCKLLACNRKRIRAALEYLASNEAFREVPCRTAPSC